MTDVKLIQLEAPPYFRQGAMHYSHRKPANGMLLNEWNYPSEYIREGVDERSCAYHDRIMGWWGSTRYYKIRDKYQLRGLATACQISDPEETFKFIKEVMKAEDPKWTGWRILGYVNVFSGHEVFRFDLFAKGEGDIPLTSGVKYDYEGCVCGF